jgi:hypothetical protein
MTKEEFEKMRPGDYVMEYKSTCPFLVSHINDIMDHWSQAHINAIDPDSYMMTFTPDEVRWIPAKLMAMR